MSESGIVWWLSQHLLITTGLAAIVLLICRVVRPNPAARHVLWLLVLCRLLVPPVATWPWSIPVAANDPRDSSYAQPTGANGVESGAIKADGTSSSADVSLPDDVLARVDSRYGNGHGDAEITPSVSGGKADMDTSVAPDAAGPVKASRQFQTAWFIAGFWAVGSLIVTVVLVRRIRRINRLLKNKSGIDTWLQNEIADWCDRLAVRVPDCVVTSEIRSPFLWFLGRVRLVWPLSASHSEQQERARSILIHELAHLKRRDHWTAWIELLALIVWWWNPVLWFVRRQLRVSAEMACDAWVVELLPDQRRTYAESLVEFSCRSRTLRRVFGAVGANTGSRRTFERRLEMIMREDLATRFSKWTVFTALLLGLLSLPAFAIKPAAQPEDPVAQSRSGASADNALESLQAPAEYPVSLNQQMDEPLPAETAAVGRNAEQSDQEFLRTLLMKSTRFSIQVQEDSDSRTESSSIPKDFIIGAEDVLRINVWKEPDISVEEVLVRPDGKISVPPIGDIEASGMTPLQLKERIEEKLKNYVSSPVVTVVVLQIKSRYVSVVGNVEKPGVYYLGSPMTVLELLARAGGCNDWANLKSIAIVRKSENRSRYFNLNYKDAVNGINLQQNIVLENGDVVIVP